jgi:alpha-galactosidase
MSSTMLSWITIGSLMILSAQAGTPGQTAAKSGPFKSVVAATPPMGWNSWDVFGTSVTEAEVKSNADYMAAHLAGFGWRYIVVDIQWAEPYPKTHGYRKSNQDLVMDEYGRLQPTINRFSSAMGGKGFKPLADYIHSKGLKFGIHIMRGIPRLAVSRKLAVKGAPVRADEIANPRSICPWLDDMLGVDMSKPHAQAYYDSLIELYASWGVDYIKADDMAYPYTHMDEIAALARAIKKNGRPIILSLSPGPANFRQAEDLKRYAHLWRISGDFWDDWKALKHTFELSRPWMAHIGADHWLDLDMLPLGRVGIRTEVGEPRWTNFSRNEQVMVMTLWSILRSPLMFGGNLPDTDDWTFSLLTNAEVLAVNQTSANNRVLFSRGDALAYAADAPGGREVYLALFNIADGGSLEIKAPLKGLGLAGRCALRDLWQKKDLGPVEKEVVVKVDAHSSVLYRLKPLE